ncbi:MAG: CoA transferase subunit A [Candidatus Hodarchaeota archaeon]
MPSRISKECSIEEAVKSIPNSSTIAIGGVHMHNSSCVTIRELIRQKKRDLVVIGSISLGIQIDMLCGVPGVVRSVTCPFVGLEIFGLAHNYRRAVENGRIEIVECCELYTSFGLRAGANNLPFMPLPYGYEYTDLPKANPQGYRRIKDPYGGPDIYTVPPLKPDVALIHVQRADPYGNGQPFGPVCVDDVMALASKRVILTCDELIEEKGETDAMQMLIPGFLVSHVVKLPYAAHPCSSSFLYDYDVEHFKEYAIAARNAETFVTYLEKYVYNPKDHFEYLTEVGGLNNLNALKYER